MGILEQIGEIEAEMARTQKNKATEYRERPPRCRRARFAPPHATPSPALTPAPPTHTLKTWAA